VGCYVSGGRGVRNLAVDLRDFQKSKVYNAEDVVWGAVAHTLPHFTDIDSIIKYINKILKRKRVQKAFHHALLGPDIDVEYCNRSTWSEAECDRIKIAARVDAHAFLVVHELAHVFQYRLYPDVSVAAHGPEFCQIYLKLTRLVFGRDLHDFLEESFIEHGVDF
jgi:putative metallohydrolase (TIGR04338 family)